MIRFALLLLALGIGIPQRTSGQDAPRSAAPTVDTVVVVTQDVFGNAEASSNFLFRLANAAHFTTRKVVVRRELLFQAGEPYDSALVAESERNLRALGIFRDVEIDTLRSDGRLAVVVRTADGWTTQLQLNARFTAGTFNWAVGAIEQNFLGRAARAGVVYRDEPDRTSLTVLAGTDRAFGSPVAIGGLYDDLSDGTRGFWTVGVPFRAFADRGSFELEGGAGDERVLQYRDGVISETYQRTTFLQRARAGYAPIATPGGYIRVGVTGQVKREEYVLRSDTGLAIPDTVTGTIGAFAEFALARFKVVTHYNGFDRPFDLDLSTRASVASWLAPASWGYPESGIGIGVSAQSGVAVGRQFALVAVRANGLFTGSGLDSGQVWVGVTVASQALPKSATVLHLQAASRAGTPPGAEYDLGHGLGPRVFGPHSFTGTRFVWGALEHRAFLIDEVVGLLGIGFAAFVDYGGAWYADQPARVGGDVGVGLRLGATRATGQNVGRIDVGYRFGDGFEGSRWALSFGQGFSF